MGYTEGALIKGLTRFGLKVHDAQIWAIVNGVPGFGTYLIAKSSSVGRPQLAPGSAGVFAVRRSRRLKEMCKAYHSSAIRI